MRGAEGREWEGKEGVKCQLPCLRRARKGVAGMTEWEGQEGKGEREGRDRWEWEGQVGVGGKGQSVKCQLPCLPSLLQW